MELFWAQGYAETSLVEIEKATGLNRRQLYNSIGDKRSMFLQALDDFTDSSTRLLLAPLESEMASVADIEELFAKFIEMAQEAGGSKGCMVCSTSQEEIAKDPEVANRVNVFFERIRAAHLNAILKTVERGEIALDLSDIQKRADALLGTHVALCILSRAGRSTTELENIADSAMKSF